MNTTLTPINTIQDLLDNHDDVLCSPLWKKTQVLPTAACAKAEKLVWKWDTTVKGKIDGVRVTYQNQTREGGFVAHNIRVIRFEPGDTVTLSAMWTDFFK
jgi:hypothetical protein